MPPVDYLAEAICRQKQKQKQQSAPTDSAAVVDAVLRETREAAIPDAAPAMDPHRAAARQRLARAPHALQGKGGRAHRTAIAGTPPRAAASEGEPAMSMLTCETMSSGSSTPSTSKPPTNVLPMPPSVSLILKGATASVTSGPTRRRGSPDRRLERRGATSRGRRLLVGCLQEHTNPASIGSFKVHFISSLFSKGRR